MNEKEESGVIQLSKEAVMTHNDVSNVLILVE